MIDLALKEALSDLLTIELNNRYIDLHNDFVCDKIIFDRDDESLTLLFKGRVEGSARLRFTDVEICKMEMFFDANPDASTLNSFYRGRFAAGETLHEYTVGGKGYYYLEFETGNELEFHARHAYFLKD